MDTATSSTDAASASFNLQRCIDALARGDCTEDEFLLETLELHGLDSTSAWDVLAFIDQRYRRGQLSEPVFHSIKSRIAQHALYDRPEGVTVELPHRGPSTPRVDSGRFLARNIDAAAAVAQPPATAIGVRRPPARPSLHTGQVLCNRYTVRGLLGRGGMGDVYKASDGLGALRTESPAHVALKMLRESLEQRPDLEARLRREFDCTRRLSHPNVVDVFEFHRVAGIAFYTMELLDGEHLGAVLDREAREPLPRPYAWGIIRAVGAALTHAHARDVIHGDVSPKNVMITRQGAVRVLDFGSCMTSASQRLTPALAVGIAATPAYASCELLEGRPAEMRDDLYSLACLAYELLTGVHPFHRRRATDARAAGLQPDRPPNLSHAQWHALLKGLSWDRAHRPDSVRLWLRELGIEPDPDHLPPRSTIPAARPPRLPPRAALAGFVGIAAIAVIAVAVGLHAPTHPEAAIGHPPPASQETLQIAAPAPDPSVLPAPERGVPVTAPVAEEAPVAAPVASGAPPIPASRRTPTPSIRRTPGAPVRFAFVRHAVGANAHFVELPIQRSRAAQAEGDFVWWTADASAKGGVDFVHQPPTRLGFAPGHPHASVFVKLLRPAGRSASRDFRVCLGKSGAGAGLADITCSSVVLPSHSG